MFVIIILSTDTDLYYYYYAVIPVPFFPIANSSDITHARSTETHLQYHNIFLNRATIFKEVRKMLVRAVYCDDEMGCSHHTLSHAT
jgi:hypothetical protein